MYLCIKDIVPFTLRFELVNHVNMEVSLELSFNDAKIYYINVGHLKGDPKSFELFKGRPTAAVCRIR